MGSSVRVDGESRSAYNCEHGIKMSTVLQTPPSGAGPGVGGPPTSDYRVLVFFSFAM